MSHRHFVFIEGSSRTDGNSAILARRAQQHLPDGASSEWLRLADLPLPDFDADVPAEAAIPVFPDGNEGVLLAATLRATDLVIASPLYWYAVSAPVKRYLDHWDGWLHLPGLRFRRRMAQRTLWAITAGYADDAGQAAGLLTTVDRRVPGDDLGRSALRQRRQSRRRPAGPHRDARRGAEDFLKPVPIHALRAV